MRLIEEHDHEKKRGKYALPISKGRYTRLNERGKRVDRYERRVFKDNNGNKKET